MPCYKTGCCYYGEVKLLNEEEEDVQVSERRRKKKTHKKTHSVPFHHVGETKLSIHAASLFTRDWQWISLKITLKTQIRRLN